MDKLFKKAMNDSRPIRPESVPAALLRRQPTMEELGGELPPFDGGREGFNDAKNRNPYEGRT